MAVQIVEREDVDVLNYCAKYITRDSAEPRHNFGQYEPASYRARICESWRFPIVDAHSDGTNFIPNYGLNDVTFVFAAESQPQPAQTVAVIGTFANLFDALPLRRLRFHDEDTPYFALTVVVPKGEVHTYQLVVDGRPTLDPINPQIAVLDNGRSWSRFFTHQCTQPISLERWEEALLQRLTDHILPELADEHIVFVAGGIDRGEAIAGYLEIGASDVQLGTRFACAR